MRRIILLALLFGFFQLANAADTTCLTIKGSAKNLLYTQVLLASFGDYNADTTQPEIVSEAWTCDGMGFPICNFRTLLKYDVSSIPAGVYITSAKLYLYAKSNALNGDHVNPMYGSSNTSLLQKVTAPWSAAGVGWLNQPAATTGSQKTLAQSTSSHQNYVVNITDFVQGWVNNPATNYGMLLRQQTEVAYNSMIFNSGQAADSLQPTLVICYTTTPPPPPTDTCVTIYGSKANGKYAQYSIGSYADYGADSSQTEIVSEAWTCNSQGFPTCNFRALIKYDVSQLPSNTTITSAKLYLYAKTNAVNGNYGNPTFGTDNTSFLQKISAPWSSATVGWANPPAVDTLTQKTLPQSSSQQQNYIVTVTDFVQDWVKNPSKNYGMQLRLKKESYYNSMIFNSGMAATNLQPKLVICYKKQTLALSVKDLFSVVEGSNVKLSWQLIDGTALASINVQRSNDGVQFNKIGEVKPITNVSASYSYIDNTPDKVTKNYYRLQFVNKDGSNSYSNIVSAKLTAGGIDELQILPNPVKSALQVLIRSAKAGKADVLIFDSYGHQAGKYAYTVPEGSSRLTINNTSNLASGFYIVQIITNGQTVTRRFVKQ